MLQTLKEFLSQLTGPADQVPPAQLAHQLQLATAVLLVEVMRAEATMKEEERITVIQALQSRFTLTRDELETLVELAHDTAQVSYDFQQFTSQLNDHFTQPQKVELIESMWQVAYADAHLDAHENHVISKIAGLLHVTHGEYIAAKMHAKAAAFPVP